MAYKYRPSQEARSTNRQLQAGQYRYFWIAYFFFGLVFIGAFMSRIPGLPNSVKSIFLIVAFIALACALALGAMIWWLAIRRAVNVLRDGKRQKAAYREKVDDPPTDIRHAGQGRHEAPRFDR